MRRIMVRNSTSKPSKKGTKIRVRRGEDRICAASSIIVSDTGKPNMDEFTLPSANDRLFIKASHPHRGLYEKCYGRDYLKGYEEAADMLFEQAQSLLAEDPETPLDVAN
jgi:CHASE3 domain sensor protein